MEIKQCMSCMSIYFTNVHVAEIRDGRHTECRQTQVCPTKTFRTGRLISRLELQEPSMLRPYWSGQRSGQLIAGSGTKHLYGSGDIAPKSLTHDAFQSQRQAGEQMTMLHVLGYQEAKFTCPSSATESSRRDPDEGQHISKVFDADMLPDSNSGRPLNTACANFSPTARGRTAELQPCP